MSNDLNNLLQEKNLVFIDLEQQSGHANKKPVLTLGLHGMHVSVSAAIKMGLKGKKYNYCRFSLVKANDKGHIDRIYIRPEIVSPDERKNKHFLINYSKLGDGAVISGVKSLYDQLPRLKKILEGKFSDRRIELNFCEISKLHYFGLGANFDQTLLSLNKVPKVKAVYRISYKDTIQNIGETNNLARRLKEKGITEVLASKGVSEIPMDKVEYSVMENATDEQRRDCEWEHLNKHKEQFGHYPPFNHQGGRKIQN